MSRNIEFHPTLVIGLGGTGQGVLLKLKKRFIDQLGEVPPIIQFLAIDTTQEANRRDTSSDGEIGVELEPNDEHYIVRVEEVANLLRGKNPHINEWWPKGTRVTTIKSGSQQIRALGRLALFASYKDLKRRLTQKLNEIRKIETMNQMQEQDFLVSTGIGVEVYVVTSLGGGTGSGMFVDVAFITRNIVPSANITGIFVLSRVFEQYPGTDLVKANTYTALKEVEHLSKLRDNESFDVNYGINKVAVNQPPYDLVYMMDSINESDRIIEKEKTLHSQIADGIYLLVGSEIGAGTSNAIDNIKSHIASAGLVENRYSGYCSFGVSSCTWKVKEFKLKLQNAKNTSSHELVGLLLGAPTDNEKAMSDVLPLTQLCSIRGDRINDLLRQIGLPGDKAKPESFVEKAKRIPSDTDRLGNIRVAHTRHLEEVEKDARANAERNHRELKTNFINDLNARQEESLARPDFLSYLASFTKHLGQAINDAKDAALDSQRRAEKDFNTLTLRFEERERSFSKGGWLRAVGRFFASMVARSSSTDHAVSDYAADVDRQCTYKEKALLCERAVLFLSELQDEVGSVAETFRQFRSRLTELQDKLKGHAKAHVGDEPEGDNPFIRVLPYCPSVEKKEVSLTEFGDWCARKSLSMRDFMQGTGDDISRILREFIDDEYKKDGEITINDVLRHKENEEELVKNQEILNYLSRQAAPLWRYRGTEIPQTQYRVENIAYCGVPKGESSPLSGLKSGWLGGKEPQFISTIDQDRITFFNITSGVPLFALSDLKEMKEEYNANKRRVCHLHRDWQDLPDLFPAQIDSPLICFAVAQAPGFQFIRKNGRGMYAIHIDRKLEKPLAKGLEKSFDQFQHDVDDVEQVMKAIAHRLSEQDRQYSIRSLESHQKRLEGLIANNGLNASGNDFIIEELGAIKAYLRDF